MPNTLVLSEGLTFLGWEVLLGSLVMIFVILTMVGDEAAKSCQTNHAYEEIGLTVGIFAALLSLACFCLCCWFVKDGVQRLKNLFGMSIAVSAGFGILAIFSCIMYDKNWMCTPSKMNTAHLLRDFSGVSAGLAFLLIAGGLYKYYKSPKDSSAAAGVSALTSSTASMHTPVKTTARTTTSAFSPKQQLVQSQQQLVQSLLNS